MDRRSKKVLESSVLGVHVCYSFLEDGAVSMEEHFVEVKVVLVLVWRPGIGNAVPVLAGLQRFCKRLLIPEVEMQFLFLVVFNGFARNGTLSNGNSGNPS